MKLPHADRLEIRKAKVVQYLLSSTHRAGKGKAAFFSAFGFTASQWEDLANALQKHACDNAVVLTENAAFGTRYVIEGALVAPHGRHFANSECLVYSWRQSDAAVCDRLSTETEGSMIQELEDVILECDLPDHGLRRGDIGTVVLVHREGKGYEVEFTTLDGETVAVVTLLGSQVRPAHEREIAHARELAGSTP